MTHRLSVSYAYHCPIYQFGLKSRSSTLPVNEITSESQSAGAFGTEDDLFTQDRPVLPL